MRPLDAALAGAAEDHLVLDDGERDVLADAPQLALEPFVGERDQAPAAIADHVVVVGVAVADGLVADDSVTDLDARDELRLLQLLEYPVHTRAHRGRSRNRPLRA